MKKILALVLSLCMLMSCMGITAFAAETVDTATPVAFEQPTEPASNSDDGISLQNKDYYTFSENATLEGSTVITVTPGAGENLKIHVYLKSGSFQVKVRKSGALFWTNVATWTNSGHHWADLVSNTNGGSYQIKLTGGTAWFSGGIYSE